jgi:starch synthase
MQRTGLLLLALMFSFTARADNLKVLFVSAERGGYFNTGGLGHAVVGAAQALNHEGIKADIIMPYYLQMKTPDPIEASGRTFRVYLDWQGKTPQRVTEFSLLKAESEKGTTLFLKHESSDRQKNYFDNRGEGRPFYGPNELQGEAWGAWSKAVADYILASDYDVVKLNDHHGALVALYLDMAKEQGRKVPRIEMVVHNLAFQGEYPKAIMKTLNIPEKYYTTENGIEFHGKANFMKAGLLLSDFSGTVSTEHAKELATPLSGSGLDGVIRRLMSEYRFGGILNGIANEEWEPARTTHDPLEHPFTPSDLSGKALGKARVQAEFGLPTKADVPLFILTSRISEQKGFVYLTDAVEDLLKSSNAQFIVTGDGDPAEIARLERLQNQYPEKFQYRPFSEHREKALTAYGDFFVNAAWFEPSGLNQFFALKNGTIPVLTKVGGLANSVVDGLNGLLVEMKWKSDHSGYDREATRESLAQTLHRAVDLFEKEPAKITEMRKIGMLQDHSWRTRVRAQMIPLLKYMIAVGPAQLRARAISKTGSAGVDPSQLYKWLREPVVPICRAAF